MKRITWEITGSGDWIRETYDVMVDIKKRSELEFMVFLSKEGEAALKWYGIWDEVQRDFPNFKTDAGPNSPFIAGPLQVGYYDMLLIAPATANTVAKIVHGIADSLVTNAVAQAAKGDAPIHILPVDQTREKNKTITPTGKTLELKMQEVDVSNSEKLAQMEKITVLKTPEEIYEITGIA